MRKLFLCFLFLLINIYCTHGSVSRYPEDYKGDKIFTYQGRSHFSWQLNEANDMMEDKCEEYNESKPVILSRKMKIMDIKIK